MLYEKFKKGINIGGWLSQYDIIAQKPLTKESLWRHFDSFIRKEDIEQIAKWQFDHIRLPLSGYLIYDTGRDCLNADVLEYLYKCIKWCSDYHLNIVMDLHDIYGNIYGAMDEPIPLLTDSVLQERFVRVWELLAQEFLGVTEPTIMFELLNEVSDASGTYPFSDITGKDFDFSQAGSFLWNQLYKKCITKIRSIDSNRWILVGSNGQNSVVYLKELEIIPDSYVFYNFHYYDPQVFTHQQAAFSDEMREFNKAIGYPDDISDFADYLNNHMDWKRKHALVAEETRNDKKLMEKLLQHAIDFSQNTGRELYCGEFGVIAHAPASAAKAWVSDLIEIFTQNHIGCALWNYKYLDFGLLDLNGNPCSNLLNSESELYQYK